MTILSWRRMAVAGAVGAILLSIGCGGQSGASAPENTDTDPRRGIVNVIGYGDDEPGIGGVVDKFCDRTTLLYVWDGGKSGGLAAVPNSPECP